MEWIKASERLPEISGQYVSEIIIIEDGLTYRPVSYHYFNAETKKWNQSNEVTEWLDESAPSQSGQEEWFDVKERLPEVTQESGNSYITTDGEEVFCLYYVGKNKWYELATDTFATGITHWRYLPSPPNQNTQ